MVRMTRAALAICLGIFLSSSTAEAQSIRAVNGRKSFSGSIASLFGGIMDTFQGGTAGQVKMAHVEGESGLVRNLSPGTAPPSGPTSIFINAGGKDNYTDTKGNTWVPDSSFVGTGRTYHKSSQPIANTDKQPIYQSERYAPELKYEIPVANGKFDVYLHWAGK